MKNMGGLIIYHDNCKSCGRGALISKDGGGKREYYNKIRIAFGIIMLTFFLANCVSMQAIAAVSAGPITNPANC
jgi:hypothetical protein